MFHYAAPVQNYSAKPSIDDTIRVGLKLLMCTTDVEPVLNSPERYMKAIVEAIDNLKYINSIVDGSCLRKRSLSSDSHDCYGTTYNTRSPLDELINELTILRLNMAHSRPLDIYNRLTVEPNEIIRRSNIEYDISMAYLFKLMLKETLVKGKHMNKHADRFSLYDGPVTDTVYRYTWRDKFIVTCYVLGHVPYTHAALTRARRLNKLKYARADIITALQYPRQLLIDYNAYIIAIDSINIGSGCI